jgi:hypothetical protein
MSAPNCNSDDPDKVAAALSDKIPEVELLMDVEELLNIVNGGKARDPNLTVRKDSKDVQALLEQAKQRCFILQNLDQEQSSDAREQHKKDMSQFYNNVMKDLIKIEQQLKRP